MKRLILFIIMAIFINCSPSITNSNDSKPIDTIAPPIPPDTVGQGEAAVFINAYLDIQFIQDSELFAVQGKNVNYASGSVVRVYINTVASDFNISADNSVSYIKQVSNSHNINKAVIINLLNIQRLREITEACKYVSSLPFAITDITDSGNNIYAQAILEVQAI
jgi:hypothetical protein